eukprot:TRINITY_DN1793_c0_g1_i1.p1 TRINITY_DN1793_c0_g1~~TRINITY_DN1793_c0_g1_i1.p1  ORF type:complete len:751 (-),score=152.81 TRINITY_DN1793_c0_g1_i1:132-2357(-)
MKTFFLFIVFILFSFCYAKNVKVNDDWIMSQRANPESIYKFTIALKLSNVRQLEKMVLDISNPLSPNYSNWLSKDEIESIISPPEEISSSIIKYLKDQCSEFEFENNKDSIKVTGPIRCAEKKKMKTFFLFIVFILFSFCYAKNVKVNDDWIMSQRANPESIYKFTIALKLSNVRQLEKMVLDISNPLSPNYSNWLSKDEIESIISPPEEISSSIIKYLKDQCSEFEFENNKDSIKVTGPIRCAEKVLKVRMMRYFMKKNPSFSVYRRHIEDTHPIFPHSLQQHISFLSGVSALPKVRKDLMTKRISKIHSATSFVNEDEFDYEYNIPQTMRFLYNIPPGTSGNNTKNSQSVFEFLPVGMPSWDDLKQFSSEADEVFNNVTRVIGPVQSGGSGESTLDIQYITTIGAGVPTYYITADGWVYDMANTLFTMNNPPLVVSLSYGWMEAQTCEADVTNANCTGIDAQQYVERANQELMKLAGLGISVLVAAQDEGAPSYNNQNCQLEKTYPVWPVYPASSQWVTTVSSTSFASKKPKTENKVEAEEPKICTSKYYGYKCSPLVTGGAEFFTMANNSYYTWTGGSGFANYTSRPVWQDSQVTRWLDPSTDKTWPIPPTVYFNPNNRAYPDVVACGDRILIIMGGNICVSAGTSASTPIFAGIVSLLNDARLNANKKPLGFLNPLFYQMQTNNTNTFHDITVGTSAWSTSPRACKYGYGCSSGWDAASGLGSINYANALAYIKNLQ